jgi:hypothetical protein
MDLIETKDRIGLSLSPSSLHTSSCCLLPQRSSISSVEKFKEAAATAKYSAGVAALILVFWIGLATPSYTQALGSVRVVFAKAGLVAGAGGGRGVLTYRGRDYPFRVSGLSLGVTIGASIMRLTGSVSGLRDVKDFSGTYDAAGGGGAWIGGLGGVQLSNGKGVLITLQGVEAGMEFAANRSAIRISLR